MTSHLNLTLAGVALAALMAACSPQNEDGAATEPASAPAPASPDVHAFRIGTFEAFALKDGEIAPPNDGSTLAVGEPKAEVDALLTAAGAPTDTLQLSIQPLLVRAGERVVLFDAGAAGQMGTQGKLPASLTAAGVSADQVTDVLISHGHGDHVGGLVNAEGGLAFPNATIRMSANEWTALGADAQLRDLVTVIAPRIEVFQPNAEVLPGVWSVDIAGHTPGHSGYRITSGDESLLYFGDAMHHSVISVQRPDWTIAFDGVEATAEASRRALLERAASENLRLYGVHFPFPGVGRVQQRGEDFVWVPET